MKEMAYSFFMQKRRIWKDAKREEVEKWVRGEQDTPNSRLSCLRYLLFSVAPAGFFSFSALPHPPYFYQMVEVARPIVLPVLLPGTQGEGRAMCEVKPRGQQVAAPGDRPARVLIKNSLETRHWIESSVPAEVPGIGQEG